MYTCLVHSCSQVHFMTGTAIPTQKVPGQPIGLVGQKGCFPRLNNQVVAYTLLPVITARDGAVLLMVQSVPVFERPKRSAISWGDQRAY